MERGAIKRFLGGRRHVVGGAAANNANHPSNQTGWTQYASKDTNVTAGAGGVSLDLSSATFLSTTYNDFTVGPGFGTTSAISLASTDSAQATNAAKGNVSLCPPKVLDADGNSYNTVVINNQCWMKEGLRTGVQLATGNTTPSNNGVIQKWCPAPNGTVGTADNLQYAANCTTYGGLYQWDEAMGYAATEGTQGICMAGWHIPTSAEQFALEDFLKISGQTCVATRLNVWECDNAGDKLKTAANCSSGGSNCGSSGFEGLLGGYRRSDGIFSNLGTYLIFWASSQNNFATSWNRLLNISTATVLRYPYAKAYGFAVRCIKD